MSTYPPPAPGREQAAKRWQRALFASFGLALVGGLVALVSEFVDLPVALVWVSLIVMGAGFVGVFTCAIGMGWTRELPWYKALWWAVRITVRAICDVF